MKKIKQVFTTEQAADIALAETFGYDARKAETHVKAPAQCLSLQPPTQQAQWADRIWFNRGQSVDSMEQRVPARQSGKLE